ncbi:unnamed protein product [Closterium sp. NIES-65]|nr:unnamed protein product [Closterium sp. NIES-65]
MRAPSSALAEIAQRASATSPAAMSRRDSAEQNSKPVSRSGTPDPRFDKSNGGDAPIPLYHKPRGKREGLIYRLVALLLQLRLSSASLVLSVLAILLVWLALVGRRGTDASLKFGDNLLAGSEGIDVRPTVAGVAGDAGEMRWMEVERLARGGARAQDRFGFGSLNGARGGDGGSGNVETFATSGEEGTSEKDEAGEVVGSSGISAVDSVDLVDFKNLVVHAAIDLPDFILVLLRPLAPSNSPKSESDVAAGYTAADVAAAAGNRSSEEASSEILRNARFGRARVSQEQLERIKGMQCSFGKGSLTARTRVLQVSADGLDATNPHLPPVLANVTCVFGADGGTGGAGAGGSGGEGERGSEGGSGSEGESGSEGAEQGGLLRVPARAAAMEVVFCPLPTYAGADGGTANSSSSSGSSSRDGTGVGAAGKVADLAMRAVTVEYEGRLFPSVALFDPIDPFDQPEAPHGSNSQQEGGEGSSGHDSNDGSRNGGSDSDGGKPHFVCMCTMIFNVGKFLREWVVYHHWMGVDRIFLYDNNSEDNTTAVVASLAADGGARLVMGTPAGQAAATVVAEAAGRSGGRGVGGLGGLAGAVVAGGEEVGVERAQWWVRAGFVGSTRNQSLASSSPFSISSTSSSSSSSARHSRPSTPVVTLHPWPWIKSQQAGFSHCVLRAARQCEWVGFIDVDEFVAPKFIAHIAERRKDLGAEVREKGVFIPHLLRRVVRASEREIEEVVARKVSGEGGMGKGGGEGGKGGSRRRRMAGGGRREGGGGGDGEERRMGGGVREREGEEVRGVAGAADVAGARESGGVGGGVGRRLLAVGEGEGEGEGEGGELENRSKGAESKNGEKGEKGKKREGEKRDGKQAKKNKQSKEKEEKEEDEEGKRKEKVEKEKKKKKSKKGSGSTDSKGEWQEGSSDSDSSSGSGSDSRTGGSMENESERAEDDVRPLGQISFPCVDFGPSGLTEHPQQGVSVGYTCRARKPDRHKSFVRPEAVADSLLCLIHQFELHEEKYRSQVFSGRVRLANINHYKFQFVLRDERYRSQVFSGRVRLANINHYRFQVWDEFKAKYRRRVATYTKDWKGAKQNSNDLIPGLGTVAVQPPDWAGRFCERNDIVLRDFVKLAFAVEDGKGGDGRNRTCLADARDCTEGRGECDINGGNGYVCLCAASRRHPGRLDWFAYDLSAPARADALPPASAASAFSAASAADCGGSKGTRWTFSGSACNESRRNAEGAGSSCSSGGSRFRLSACGRSGCGGLSGSNGYGRWRRLPPIPPSNPHGSQRCRHFSVAAIPGWGLAIAGGVVLGTGEAVRHVSLFDWLAGRWVQVQHEGFSARLDPVVVWAGGRLFVGGGGEIGGRWKVGGRGNVWGAGMGGVQGEGGVEGERMSVNVTTALHPSISPRSCDVIRAGNRVYARYRHRLTCFSDHPTSPSAAPATAGATADAIASASGAGCVLQLDVRSGVWSLAPPCDPIHRLAAAGLLALIPSLPCAHSCSPHALIPPSDSIHTHYHAPLRPSPCARHRACGWAGGATVAAVQHSLSLLLLQGEPNAPPCKPPCTACSKRHQRQLENQEGHGRRDVWREGACVWEMAGGAAGGGGAGEILWGAQLKQVVVAGGRLFALVLLVDRGKHEMREMGVHGKHAVWCIGLGWCIVLLVDRGKHEMREMGVHGKLAGVVGPGIELPGEAYVAHAVGLCL